MAGVTAALSIADALKTQAVAGVVETLFRNNEVMGEFQMRPFTGGSTINVKMHYAGNTSVSTYAEGDATGVAGAQSYLTALWPEQHYKCVVQITGHACDYTLNGSSQAVFFDQLSMEMEKGVNDITHQVSLDMLGSGTTAPVGIQGIVSSTGTVAGINRSTFTWFQSYQGSNGTTIAIVDLDTAMYNVSDQPYAAQISAIWTSWKQSAKLKGVIGNAGQANAPIRINVDKGGPVQLNTGSVGDPQFYGSTEIKKKRNLTNSIFLGLTESTFFIGKMRDFTVKQLGPTDDSDRYLLTTALSLGCDNPEKNYKMTGYTA